MAVLTWILSSLTVTSVLGAVILSKILYNCYVGWFHLSDFPGPRPAAFTRLWIARAYAQKNAGQIFLEANQKYGSVSYSDCPKTRLT